jgi:alpha-tubulin suppressor-like RCC1 family protein
MARRSADNDVAMAVKTDGTLWSWGDGNFGVLGTNDTIDKSSPVQIGALTTWDKEFG